MDEPLASGQIRPVQMLRASHQIAKQIEDMILSGSLKPGDRLPGERVLAERFSTSRNPIREALRALEALGYVVVKAGKGAFVAASYDTNAMERILGQTFDSRREQFVDAVVIHRALFAEAAYMAAENHTAKQLSAAENALEEQEISLEKNDKMGLLYSDRLFTGAIAEMCRSSTLSRMVPESMDYLKGTRMTLFALPSSEYARKSIREHRRILRAIANGDPVEAATRAREHVQSAMEDWRHIEEKTHDAA